MRLGIIGATGWLGSALGQQLLDKGILAPEALVLLNQSGRKGVYASHNEVIWASDCADLVARSDAIVLSLRPGDWPGLGFSAPGRLVISFMAGIRAADIGASGARVIRAMPNAAAANGASYTPWWAGEGVSAEDRLLARRILRAIGEEEELCDEDHLDLMTAVPGSGAAYPALLAMAMRDFLVARGIGPQTAWRAASAAVCDGARLIEGGEDHAAALLQAYRDYKGTTEAGLIAAEAAGFSGAVARALDAATKKAADMG